MSLMSTEASPPPLPADPTTEKAAAAKAAADAEYEKKRAIIIAKVAAARKAQEVRRLAQSLVAEKAPKKKAEKKKPKFWPTQPMSFAGDVIPALANGPIAEPKTPDQVKQEPYQLPKGFEWATVNIMDPKQVQEVYVLLTENYVEDDDCMFRFDYSIPFLQWALTPPDYFKEWHVGVRQTSNGKLRAFITGIPVKVRIHKSETRNMSEINFLCIHKKLRSVRLAPVLIKEVTRRVNLEDQWQAVYTAGIVLTKPVAKCRYWHRSLNPKKLIAVGFSRLGRRMKMSMAIRLAKVPARPQIPGIQPMSPEHVESAHALLTDYLSRYSLNISFTVEEVAHWFLPRAGIIDAFVVCKPGTNEVTDMCSFYHLPSSIMKHETYKKLNAAYSFYNVATTVDLKELMKDCLTYAKIKNCDVFNALDIMENVDFFKELKFGIGDGNLQYYLYNWRCPEMTPQKVGIVLM